MKSYRAPFSNLSHVATPYHDASGSQLSRVQITRRFSGDAVGESTSELLLCQTSAGVMAYAGTDHFVGEVAGRAGSFVFQHAGILENGQFTGFGYIVPTSPTNALKGLRGRATVHVGPGGQHELHLDAENE